MTVSELVSHVHAINGLMIDMNSPGLRIAGQGDGNVVIYENSTARWALSWYSGYSPTWNSTGWSLGDRYAVTNTQPNGSTQPFNVLNPYIASSLAIRL